MKLRYDISLDDLVAFNLHLYRSSSVVRRAMAKQQWYLSISVFISIVGVTKLVDVHANTIATILAAMAIAGLCFFAFPRLEAQSAEKRIKQILGDEAKNKSSLGEHELELVQDGLVERTAAGEKKTKWLGIERIETSAAHTFVYSGAATAYVIPKSTVREGDYESFILAVRQQHGRAE